MFKKLFTAEGMDYKILDKQIEFELDQEGRRIQYLNISSAYLDRFITSLGPYSNHFYSSFVNIETDVPPHTDIVDSVSFNFYMNPGQYQTTFYTSKDNSSKQTYADHGDGYVYKLDELEVLDSYIAEPGDVYLLNGKIIHGVTSLTSTKLPRQFLQVSTNDLTYNQVLEIIRNVC